MSSYHEVTAKLCEIFLVAESLAPVENSAHVTVDLSVKYLSVLAFL